MLHRRPPRPTLRRCAALLTALVLPVAGCDGSPTEASEAVAFETVVQDSVSARHLTARQEVARDEVAWRNLWREIFPAAPVPSVDFGREMTIVAVLAPQPCTSRVTIEALSRDADLLSVSLVENPTPPGCACVAPVQPLHIVRSQRIDLAAEFRSRTGPPAVCGS